MKDDVRNFIFLKDKKGISAIIVTLLMIVLSLVAVGAVWVVISNVLSSGTEQTSSAFGQITLSMKIESVKTDSNGDVLVAVKRNAGAGDLSGINLIVSDGTNSQIIKKDESISELATKTFTITSAELTDVAFVKEIQIAPISKDSSGKETIGNAVDKETLTTKQILQSLGAVSWWRMEGNAQDEIGDNDGTLQGDVGFVNGKYGNAVSLDGVDDYVEVLTSQMSNQVGTIFYWSKPEGWTGGDNSYQGGFQTVAPGSWNNNPGQITIINQWPSSPNVLYFRISADTSCCIDLTLPTSTIFNNGNWVSITSTWDRSKSRMELYINGNLETSRSDWTASMTPSLGPKAYIGVGHNKYHHGQIDEVMIFNKALTDTQVKALYELDLS